MMTVWILLLTSEFFYGSSTAEQGGNRVSCDNTGVPYTFVKNSTRVPASSSTLDSKRALQEVNRRASNTYHLEHGQGHHDKTKRFRDLSPDNGPRLVRLYWYRCFTREVGV